MFTRHCCYHFTVYTNIKSVCYIPETDIFCLNYTSVKNMLFTYMYMYIYTHIHTHGNFHGGSDGKESTCNFWIYEFDPLVGQISCRRAWQPTPVFLLGKSHREEPDGLQSIG